MIIIILYFQKYIYTKLYSYIVINHIIIIIFWKYIYVVHFKVFYTMYVYLSINFIININKVYIHFYFFFLKFEKRCMISLYCMFLPLGLMNSLYDYMCIGDQQMLVTWSYAYIYTPFTTIIMWGRNIYIYINTMNIKPIVSMATHTKKSRYILYLYKKKKSGFISNVSNRLHNET
jgi:hypothetical protein